MIGYSGNRFSNGNKDVFPPAYSDHVSQHIIRLSPIEGHPDPKGTEYPCLMEFDETNHDNTRKWIPSKDIISFDDWILGY